MAHVILGLLLIAPQSLYDLIRGFEAGVALFYSASSGSIKRALDGLLAQQLIEVASIDAGGRGRKVYRVTDAGRREFRSWMTGELVGSDLEGAALPRLYFLGLLDPVEREPVLRRIRMRIETDLGRLSALDASLETVEIPEDLRAVARYQRSTLDYGIASLRFALDWFRDFSDHTEETDRSD